ncbi:hypothetical protein QF004_002474 [Chryseobacterium sp. MDT2-18]|nr:hypothetical protein [Chryseobacterium sp. MDT2-18]
MSLIIKLIKSYFVFKILMSYKKQRFKNAKKNKKPTGKVGFVV